LIGGNCPNADDPVAMQLAKTSAILDIRDSLQPIIGQQLDAAQATFRFPA
jgi:hypothetical protein